LPPVDQNDLEFYIPAYNETYIHLDIKLHVWGKLVSGSAKDVDASDHTAVNINFLHSLFSHCNFALNGITITKASEHYYYRSYFVPLLNYGTDAAARHITNTYSYGDTGDTQPCDPAVVNVTATTNRGFIARWDKLSASKELQLSGCLHSDLFTVPFVLLPGAILQN